LFWLAHLNSGNKGIKLTLSAVTWDSIYIV
jgi:hypothetical protein